MSVCETPTVGAVWNWCSQPLVMSPTMYTPTPQGPDSQLLLATTLIKGYLNSQSVIAFVSVETRLLLYYLWFEESSVSACCAFMSENVTLSSIQPLLNMIVSCWNQHCYWRPKVLCRSVCVLRMSLGVYMCAPKKKGASWALWGFVFVTWAIGKN